MKIASASGESDAGARTIEGEDEPENDEKYDDEE
jgi:hypothetical protein